MAHFKALLFPILFIAFTSIGLPAQTLPRNDSAQRNSLLEQANRMVQAFTAKDYETFVRYSYPAIVQSMGGEAAMIKILTTELEKVQAEGITFQSVSIGQPSALFRAGAERHAIVAQTLVMKVSKGTVTKKSRLLAVSTDEGAHWYFIDTAPLNNANITTLFPRFNKDLVIPAQEKPVFTPSE